MLCCEYGILFCWRKGNLTLHSLALSLQWHFHQYVNPYCSLFFFSCPLSFEKGRSEPFGYQAKAKLWTIMHLIVINHSRKILYYLHRYMWTCSASSYFSFSTLASQTAKRVALSLDTDLRSALAFPPCRGKAVNWKYDSANAMRGHASTYSMLIGSQICAWGQGLSLSWA